jgi:hypothetical protein
MAIQEANVLEAISPVRVALFSKAGSGRRRTSLARAMPAVGKLSHMNKPDQPNTGTFCVKLDLFTIEQPQSGPHYPVVIWEKSSKANEAGDVTQ